MEEKLNNIGEMIGTAVDKSKKLKEGILKSEWEKIVGRLVNDSQPEYIKDGILTIVVKSPFFVHHFFGKKEEYIEKINKYFGKDVITDINVRSGEIDKERELYLNRENSEDETSKKEGLKSEQIKNKEQEKIEPEKKEDKSESFDMSEAGIIKKLSQLREMAQERERYLLSQGYRKCVVCGVIFEPTEDNEICKMCETAKKDREMKKNKEIQEFEEFEEDIEEGEE